MKNEEIIIILLIAFVLFLINNQNNNEHFNIIIKSNTNSEEISKFWKIRGYKLIKVPNFFEIFGLSNLSKNFEFMRENNWKLFTNTDLIKDEGLASLISSDKIEDIRFYDLSGKKLRVTGFKKPSAIIGITTPTKILPSGQWLKSFTWIGSSNYKENTNAKNVIVWANHKNNIIFGDV